MGDNYELPVGLKYLPDDAEVVAVVGVTRTRAATTAALAANTRTENVLEADANGALGTIDGVADLAVGDLLLVQDEVTGANNGVYKILAVGGASAKWSMERAEGWNATGRVKGGQIVAVSEGTANGNSLFMLTTDDAITLNTTALVFSTAVATAIGAGDVDTAHLAADAVDGTKIADDAIDSEHLVDGSVDPVHMVLDGLGAADVAVDHADGAATTLLTAPTGVALAFVLVAECTESITAAVFELGNGTASDHFDDGTIHTANGTAGDKFTYAGKLEPGETLDVEPTTAGTAGAFKYTVVSSPVTAT